MCNDIFQKRVRPEFPVLIFGVTICSGRNFQVACFSFTFLESKRKGETDTLLRGGVSARYRVPGGGLYQIHWQSTNTHERRRTCIVKLHANLSFFRACISPFLTCFRKGKFIGDAGNVLSRFTGVHLVFEVFQTKAVHFCLCLVRIKMPLLTWGVNTGLLLNGPTARPPLSCYRVSLYPYRP